MNPLGAKGIGESATVGSTPAVQNAVVDALRPFGVRHVDLPCTPERVWRAIHGGRGGPVARAARGVRHAAGAAPHRTRRATARSDPAGPEPSI